jgi:peptidyl-tRNA hydrolase
MDKYQKLGRAYDLLIQAVVRDDAQMAKICVASIARHAGVDAVISLDDDVPHKTAADAGDWEGLTFESFMDALCKGEK